MNAIVFTDEQHIGYAIWYPQMGGHVGRAVAVCDKRWSETQVGSRLGGCIDVHVWHNGDFPFGDDETPVVIHHCAPEQFIEFGQALTRLNLRSRDDVAP